mmetsp:Transcript_28606/g.27399  ORF Transcript_28606/g.27399 Transcript_28606/m.27399 type:complete len:717 (+) Transcript_28606:543-2693(+)|eukprot:CAMPEP_0119040262 /NCGR_PEP_ID=MMETSP1177-20130426/10125_1 /TAXON_ID=2985 /ORGANISM="Ochromonas sp, Strain CCMP1899" /LENGTH=716 /DNA_ID=CAMNT_0007005133 /DNA_START=288 /DNA_END=2438 /DNA_ORIENTATION=+
MIFDDEENRKRDSLNVNCDEQNAVDFLLHNNENRNITKRNNSSSSDKENSLQNGSICHLQTNNEEDNINGNMRKDLQEEEEENVLRLKVLKDTLLSELIAEVKAHIISYSTLEGGHVITAHSFEKVLVENPNLQEENMDISTCDEIGNDSNNTTQLNGDNLISSSTANSSSSSNGNDHGINDDNIKTESDTILWQVAWNSNMKGILLRLETAIHDWIKGENSLHDKKDPFKKHKYNDKDGLTNALTCLLASYPPHCLHTDLIYLKRLIATEKHRIKKKSQNMIKSKYGYTIDKSVKIMCKQESKEYEEIKELTITAPSSSDTILLPTSNSFLSYINGNVIFSLKRAHCNQKVKDLLALYPWPFSQDNSCGNKGGENGDLEGGIDVVVARDNGGGHGEGRKGIGAHTKIKEEERGIGGVHIKGKLPGRGVKKGNKGKVGSLAAIDRKASIEFTKKSNKKSINFKNSKEKIMSPKQPDKHHVVKSGPSFTGIKLAGMSMASLSSSTSHITGDTDRQNDATASDGYIFGNSLNGLACLSSSQGCSSSGVNDMNDDEDDINCNSDNDRDNDNNDNDNRTEKNMYNYNDNNDSNTNDNNDSNNNDKRLNIDDIDNNHKNSDYYPHENIVNNGNTEVAENTKRKFEQYDSNNDNDSNIHDVYNSNDGNKCDTQKDYDNDHKNIQNCNSDHKRSLLTEKQMPLIGYEGFTNPPTFDLNDFALS